MSGTLGQGDIMSGIMSRIMSGLCPDRAGNTFMSAGNAKQLQRASGVQDYVRDYVRYYVRAENYVQYYVRIMSG